MSKPPCPQLDAVLSAAGGALPDELGRHAAGCPECADALLVQGFLVAGAARMVPVALPDAGAVYWRARLRERLHRAERATRPIAVLDRVSYALAAAVLAALALSQGRSALDWLRGLGEHAGAAAHAVASPPDAMGAVIGTAPGLALAAVVIGAPLLLWNLYLTWAEE
jgi:hypothetical protein